jgi:hypothetical protein
MKTLSVIVTAVVLAIGLAGCSRNKVDTASLKPVETRTVGNVTVVLMNSTGELKQGPNDFIIQFRDQQGQPIDVGDVQLSSSMTMPSMAPMSGDSEITITEQEGTYRVKSSFAMSGAWHFTIAWNGPYGQGSTAFNSNVR